MKVSIHVVLPVLGALSVISFWAGRASVPKSSVGVAPNVRTAPQREARSKGSAQRGSDSAVPRRADEIGIVELGQMKEKFRSGTTLERNEAGTELACYFAKRDPEAGVNWLLKIGPLEESAGWASLFGSSLARGNKGQFLELSRRFLGTAQFVPFVSGGLLPIGAHDFNEAWNLAKEFSRFADNPQAFEKSLFLNLAQVNGEGASKVVDLNKSEDVALEFFSRAVFKDQRQAVLALEGIADAETRGNALDTYSRGCEIDDGIKFADALTVSSLDQVSRDKGIAAVVNQLFYHNLTEAVRLVKEIEDAPLQNSIIKKIVEYAERTSSEAGEEARRTFGL